MNWHNASYCSFLCSLSFSKWQCHRATRISNKQTRIGAKQAFIFIQCLMNWSDRKRVNYYYYFNFFFFFSLLAFEILNARRLYHPFISLSFRFFFYKLMHAKQFSFNIFIYCIYFYVVHLFIYFNHVTVSWKLNINHWIAMQKQKNLSTPRNIQRLGATGVKKMCVN